MLTIDMLKQTAVWLRAEADRLDQRAAAVKRDIGTGVVREAELLRTVGVDTLKGAAAKSGEQFSFDHRARDYMVDQADKLALDADEHRSQAEFCERGLVLCTPRWINDFVWTSRPEVACALREGLSHYPSKEHITTARGETVS